MTKATLIGVSLLVTIWVGLSILVWQALGVTAGWSVAERLATFNNAHLLEEAAQGIYKPWRDPMFIVSLILNTAVPVAIATFMAGRREVRAAIAVTAVALIAFMMIDGLEVTAPGYPVSMKAAFVIELSVVVVTGLLITVVVWRGSRSRSAA